MVLAPIYPVYPSIGLQFVLIAYVAVVLGGLGDMVGALIASLVVAVVEVVGSYVIGTAWKEVLYLVLFIAILVIRPAGLFGSVAPRRSAREQDVPGGRLLRRRRPRPVVVRDAFLLDGLILILLWGASAAAWNVAGGYAGQVSLGHSAFFGLGAYSAALLGTRWGVSPWIGAAWSAPSWPPRSGFILGFLSNRLRGPYFVLATIAFSQVLLIVASRWRGFTSGSEGIPVPFRPGFWTLGIADKRVWVYLVLVLAVLLYLVQLYLERSRRGYQLAAVREDEDAALSLGVPARRLKVAAIAASAALTAACGTLWAQYVGFVDPFYVFSVDLSVRFCLAAILGGIGTPLGPVPRRRPHHDARDVAARPLRRHRRRSRRDLPDHLRRRAHRHGALRAARPGAVDR